MMKKGYFGEFGGSFIPELLVPVVNEVAQAYEKYRDDADFQAEYAQLLRGYANRPSLLYHAQNLTAHLGGAQIYLKREDLNHTGAHKINNVLGQALLAKKMGKTRLIAETGAGQHGVATATVGALFGMEVEVFMGAEDVARQALNVYRMELLGATVHEVTDGTATLKDATNAAFQNWTTRVDDTYYLIGSAVGPYPYPEMVKDFQRVIGDEAREQMQAEIGQLPDAVIAAVGGGSNAIGSFSAFVADEQVRLIGVEAAGKGIHTTQHAATMAKGSTGVFHGMKSRFLQSADGQIDPVYSISAGLDYPGVGPEHVHLMANGRAEYVSITDEEAVAAFELIAKTEGIVAAIESSHAVAQAIKLAPTLPKDDVILVTLSGRGDKDVAAIARFRGVNLHD
ncbi:MAG TPA: tryptophan synthase subunit beta [Lactobacillaceae bacterium]|jgi:tryptophan synthase beta chain